MANRPPPVTAPTTVEWHLRDADEVTQAHDVNPSEGLRDSQVADRATKFGVNALPTADKRSLWSLVLEQFTDFMVLVLLAAAAISGFVGELVDALVILVIVFLNAAVGLVQSWRADQALAALQRFSAARATVLRSGKVQKVPAHVLVPGDIVLLEAGNQIPADLRLI